MAAAAAAADTKSAAAAADEKKPLLTVADPWADAKWIKELEADPSLVEVENRPWANWKNRRRAGCVGSDYVKDENTVLLRFFWNPTNATLTGAVHFTDRAEGPPSTYHHITASLHHRITASPDPFFASRIDQCRGLLLVMWHDQRARTALRSLWFSTKFWRIRVCGFTALHSRLVG